MLWVLSDILLERGKSGVLAVNFVTTGGDLILPNHFKSSPLFSGPPSERILMGKVKLNKL